MQDTRSPTSPRALTHLPSAALAILLAAGLAAGLGACNKDNPNHCEGAGCDIDAAVDAAISCTPATALDDCPDDQPVCGTGNECTGCTMPSDCTGRTGHPACYDPGPNGGCGECDTDDAESSFCSGSTPICDGSDHTCRACAADGECASGMCDTENGACAATADVIYLNPTATDNPNCTAAAKCQTVPHGLTLVTSSRRFIKMDSGTYDNGTTTATFPAGSTIVVHGDRTNRPIVRRNNDGVIFDFISGSNVQVQDVILDGEDANNNDVAKCSSATASLHRVEVRRSEKDGIDSDGCALTVTDSRVTGSAELGIKIGGASSTVTILRSTLDTNDRAALEFNGSILRLVNNVVYGNTAMATTAAINLVDISNPASSRIEFNTVTENASAVAAVGGIGCASATVNVRNSIIFNNNGTAETLTCSFTYSLIGDAVVPPGAGNFNDNPMFLDPASRNYGLMAASPARGKADPGTVFDSLNDTDFDGEPRPQPSGGPADVGADEVP